MEDNFICPKCEKPSAECVEHEWNGEDYICLDCYTSICDADYDRYKDGEMK